MCGGGFARTAAWRGSISTSTAGPRKRLAPDSIYFFTRMRVAPCEATCAQYSVFVAAAFRASPQTSRT